MKPPFEKIPESRRATRRAVELFCDVVAPHEDYAEQALGTDLSQYGMSLMTDVPLDVGDVITVTFTPPGRDITLTLFGLVRRSFLDIDVGQFDTGIEFVNITPFETKLLRDALVGIPPKLPALTA